MADVAPHFVCLVRDHFSRHQILEILRGDFNVDSRHLLYLRGNQIHYRGEMFFLEESSSFFQVVENENHKICTNHLNRVWLRSCYGELALPFIFCVWVHKVDVDTTTL